MRRLLFTPAARAGLDGILTYTENAWGSGQAEHHILLLRDACDALAAGVRHGRAVKVRGGYRRYDVRSHAVFYRLDGEDALVVVRILHGRMDIPRRLRE